MPKILPISSGENGFQQVEIIESCMECEYSFRDGTLGPMACSANDDKYIHDYPAIPEFCHLEDE